MKKTFSILGLLFCSLLLQGQVTVEQESWTSIHPPSKTEATLAQQLIVEQGRLVASSTNTNTGQIQKGVEAAYDPRSGSVLVGDPFQSLFCWKGQLASAQVQWGDLLIQVSSTNIPSLQDYQAVRSSLAKRHINSYSHILRWSTYARLIDLNRLMSPPEARTTIVRQATVEQVRVEANHLIVTLTGASGPKARIVLDQELMPQQVFYQDQELLMIDQAVYLNARSWRTLNYGGDLMDMHHLPYKCFPLIYQPTNHLVEIMGLRDAKPGSLQFVPMNRELDAQVVALFGFPVGVKMGEQVKMVHTLIAFDTELGAVIADWNSPISDRSIQFFRLGQRLFMAYYKGSNANQFAVGSYRELAIKPANGQLELVGKRVKSLEAIKQSLAQQIRDNQPTPYYRISLSRLVEPLHWTPGYQSHIRWQRESKPLLSLTEHQTVLLTACWDRPHTSSHPIEAIPSPGKVEIELDAQMKILSASYTNLDQQRTNSTYQPERLNIPNDLVELVE